MTPIYDTSEDIIKYFFDTICTYYAFFLTPYINIYCLFEIYDLLKCHSAKYSQFVHFD